MSEDGKGGGADLRAGQQATETNEQRQSRLSAGQGPTGAASGAGTLPESTTPPGSSQDAPSTDNAAEDSTPDGSSVRCGHARCNCIIAPPELWCSETCRDQQQGFESADEGCGCGHELCRSH